MLPSELILVLPCHSLEDFPAYHEGNDAASLLNAWTILWHPALVGSVDRPVTWWRGESPGEPTAGQVIVIPSVSLGAMPIGWHERTTQQGALVIRDCLDRPAMLRAVLDYVGDDAPQVDSDLTADFMALGYALLEIEILTRQMRYSSHIDEEHFRNEATAAAKAALAGDGVEARRKLSACFDLLSQSRDQFYPVDSYLVDLTLVADTTIGKELASELAKDSARNYLIGGEVLASLAAKQPETLQKLKAAIADGKATLVGGDPGGASISQLGEEPLLATLRNAREKYCETLGSPPGIFGSLGYALRADLPQVLARLGYQSVLHMSLDGGRFPQSDQMKTRWEGPDGAGIDALAKPALDASLPETYLGLAQKISSAMDHDHVATLVFAHWPSAAAPWFEDLRRVTRYSSALGKLVTLDKYFETTAAPGLFSRFLPHQYQPPILRRALRSAAKDVLSTSMRAQDAESRRTACAALATMAATASGRPATEASDVATAVANCATAIAGSGKADGYLLLNPTLAARRMNVEVEWDQAQPDLDDHVRVVALRKKQLQAVVDVPPMGFVWLGPGKGNAAARGKSPSLASGLILRNEHFEAVISNQTGGLSAIRFYERRGNLLACQLALRLGTEVPSEEEMLANDPRMYSSMEADKVEVTQSTDAVGEIASRGRLVDRKGNLLAQLEQVFRLWRGSRVLEMEVTLSPEGELVDDPWASYFAARFAWSDGLAELVRSVGRGRYPTQHHRFESPRLVEVHSDLHRVSIFPDGLPLCMKSGDRMIDMPLVIRGETARTFRLAAGIDVRQPAATAEQRMIEEQELVIRSACPAGGRSGWLFHCSAKEVLATWWAPVIVDGQVVGARVRLIETIGRAARFSLAAPYTLTSAELQDYDGGSLSDLSIDGEKAIIDVAAYEWIQVEIRWKS